MSDKSESSERLTVPEIALESMKQVRSSAAAIKNKADDLGLAPPGTPPQPHAVNVANLVQGLAEQAIGQLPQSYLPQWPENVAEPAQIIGDALEPGEHGLRMPDGEDVSKLTASLQRVLPQLGGMATELGQTLKTGTGGAAAVAPASATHHVPTTGGAMPSIPSGGTLAMPGAVAPSLPPVPTIPTVHMPLDGPLDAAGLAALDPTRLLGTVPTQQPMPADPAGMGATQFFPSAPGAAMGPTSAPAPGMPGASTDSGLAAAQTGAQVATTTAPAGLPGLPGGVGGSPLAASATQAMGIPGMGAVPAIHGMPVSAGFGAPIGGIPLLDAGGASVSAESLLDALGKAGDHGSHDGIAPVSAGGIIFREPSGVSPSIAAPAGATHVSNHGTPPELPTMARFDPYMVRRDFPALHQQVNGRNIVWLDNAATTQKPQAVIDAIANYYARDNSNVHRGAHTLAARATDAYEWGREKVQKFLGAQYSEEIVFVRGCTEGINLVAKSWGRTVLSPGDQILVTELEHHSNIVPWQMLARVTGAKLKVIPISDTGEVRLDAYEAMLSNKVKIVSIGHVSNALGTILPVKTMTDMAHNYGAGVVIDGAQSLPHFKVDVRDINADFYVFSGHKLFAPTGIGAVYGRKELLEKMPPWQGGGSMIEDVTFDRAVFKEPPAKFEAGTGNIAGAVGLGAAIEYLERIGFHLAEAYEQELLKYMTWRLSKIKGIRLIGTAPEKAGVQSFVMKDVSVETMGQALDQHGIAVRAGHHCAQPALRHFGLESTVRPSLAFYNTPEDVDRLIAAIHDIVGHRLN